jgi:lipoyl-dependent peroxiredoxin
MIRKAKAVWNGTGRAGSGHLSSESGVLAETPHSIKTRFENEKGTNPRGTNCGRPCRLLHHGAGLRSAGRRLYTNATITLDAKLIQ